MRDPILLEPLGFFGPDPEAVLNRLVAVGATPTHSAVSVGYADPRRVRSYAEVVAAPFLAESRGSKRTLSASGRTLTLRQCASVVGEAPKGNRA